MTGIRLARTTNAQKYRTSYICFNSDKILNRPAQCLFITFSVQLRLRFRRQLAAEEPALDDVTVFAQSYLGYRKVQIEPGKKISELIEGYSILFVCSSKALGRLCYCRRGFVSNKRIWDEDFQTIRGQNYQRFIFNLLRH